MLQQSLAVKKISAALLLLSLSGLAFADDQPAAKTDACPPPAMLATGWYLGIQGGFDSYSARNNIASPGGAAISTLNANPTLRANGWVGGMMLGYGMMVNKWFYLGAEIFANSTDAEQFYSSTTGASTYTNKFQVRSNYGIGILPGVQFTDQTRNYIRLGWNGANFKTRETVSGIPVGARKNSSNGFALGVGMETYTADNWSLRAEFDHTWYSAYWSDGAYGTRVTPSDNQFLAAMLYHFA